MNRTVGAEAADVTVSEAGPKLPPKPRLALTIGAVGHRPKHADAPGLQLDEANAKAAVTTLLTAIQQVLAEVAGEALWCFAEGTPLLSIVTGLAEGSDCVAAEAAHAMGLPFQVVLPFAQNEFEATFDGGEPSTKRFRELLGKASAKLILPRTFSLVTDNDANSASYEQAAITILAQSDVLIAIWDGDAGSKRGGTGRSVEEALRQETPVLAIHPATGALRLCLKSHVTALANESAVIAALRVLLRTMLDPPALSPSIPASSGFSARCNAIVARLLGAVGRRVPRDDTEIEGLRAFLETSVENRRLLPGWRWFHKLMRPRFRPDAHPATNGETEPKVDTPIEIPHFDLPGNHAALDRLADAQNTADAIAVHYSHAFRTAFIVNSLLGAAIAICVGVTAFLLSTRFEKHVEFFKHAAAVGELTVLLLLVLIVLIVNKRKWRRRWSESREVAERMRLAPTFWMLGVWPHVLSVAQPAWTGWYVRSILREQPLYSGDISALIGTGRASLQHILDEQISYNETLAHNMHHIDRRIEMLSFALLTLTVAAAAWHVATDFHVIPSLMWFQESLLLTMAILSPALAGACFSIRLFGDFEDAKRRAERLTRTLRALQTDVVALDVDDVASAPLTRLHALARRASDILLADVANWRVATDSRNLSV